MVKTAKKAKDNKSSSKRKASVPENSKKKTLVEESAGSSLDDAFEGDDDVTYAESKPKKVSDDDENLDDEEVVPVEESERKITLVASKPLMQVKKGDKIVVDGKILEVDAHYVLIDHGSTREMAIELFDSKTDKDYQLRYFDDQIERTLDFYELNEILYNKRPFSKVSW